ncbi:MAG TPA: dienelactone hydrolase family protein [Methylomirabilota bacterium]|nr:dienelactone hydrolase family protein [Methylomirabilota bacterium]
MGDGGAEEDLLTAWLVLVALLAAGCSNALSSVTEGRTGRLDVPSFTIGPRGVDEATTVSGDLSIPGDAGGRVPAVIVLHSCSGMTPNLVDWAQALNLMGFAAFLLDSFTARGVTEVCTGRSSVTIDSRLVDAYRALALLSAHPRIDPRRIALLGFSQGGWVALWASQAQIEHRFLRANVEFAAHAAFYPFACNVRLQNETAMTPGPVRIFHGTADDWTPIAACRDWVARRQAAGRDVSLVAYDRAMHAFDVPLFAPPRRWPGIFNPGKCAIIERPDHAFVTDDGRPLSSTSPCVTRGATLGYDARAHRQSIVDVRTFLDEAFTRR